jgi:hypothetical protein
MTLIVMPGLDPGIHGSLTGLAGDAWMAGSSPAMTILGKTVFVGG